jgi:hypothetical protein
MEVKGTIKKIYDVENGTSKNGTQWQKRDFVIETNEQYPKTVCFTVFKHVDILEHVGEGQTVNVKFSIDSREYNGKWYHSINAFGVYPEGSTPAKKEEKVTEAVPEVVDEEDELPF